MHFENVKKAVLSVSCLFIVASKTEATDVHRLDGYIHRNVQELIQVDDFFIFKVSGKSYTLDSRRIKKIIDDSGTIIFEKMDLTAKKIVIPGSPIRFIFTENGEYAADGTWKSKGIFQISGYPPDGVYFQYADSGKLERKFTIKNNALNGPCTVLYPSGYESRIGDFVDNKEVGMSKLFYQTGELKGESNYIDGMIDGSTKLYYRSGMLQMEMLFERGVPVGQQKIFYESGKLQTEVFYRGGVKDGLIKSYYESGKLSMTGTYSNGKENGEFITYYESGRVKKKKMFVYGRILSKNK